MFGRSPRRTVQRHGCSNRRRERSDTFAGLRLIDRHFDPRARRIETVGKAESAALENENRSSAQMALEGYTLAAIAGFVGKELGVSSWIIVDQKRIDAFAACTGDHQWIHVDVDRAKRESPFGTTIAHGFMTLSLLPVMQYEVGALPAGVAVSLNYGIDRVRFITPVRSGARVRGRITLAAAEDRGGGRILMTLRNTVEIEDEEKPALVADTLALLLAEV
jgi:acyl dehydratase